MAHKPSRARYDRGGKVMYLAYRSPQPLPSGRVAMRTRIKRLYFPGDASNITLGKLSEYRNLRHRSVFGVAVAYRYVLAPATIHRGKTIAHLPPRKAHRTKIVPLPRDARDLQLTARPPKGPLQAAA